MASLSKDRERERLQEEIENDEHGQARERAADRSRKPGSLDSQPGGPADRAHDLIDDSVMRRINYRVARLGRKYCLSVEDREDIRQEFCLALCRAAQAYDPERCPLHGFVRMVLNRQYKHLVRKLARADSNRARSVRTLHFDDVKPGLEYHILDPKAEDNLHRVELREDVRAIVRSLPADLRSICQELMSHSPFEVARRLGVHHSAIYRAIKRIRQHFAEAGIEEKP